VAARKPGSGLAGLTVVLPRTPDRAAAMAAELGQQGANVALMPLIDFQFPADTAELDRALKALRSGRFAWVIFTSVTTVRAMVRRCAALGVPVTSAVPSATCIAAVGAGTRQALEDIGLDVDLMPEGDQSARGLAESWPHPSGTDPEGRGLRILLPQADLADPALAAALTGLGWEVRPVTAYCTVDFPATGVRFTPALEGSPAGGPRILTPQEFLADIPKGPRAVAQHRQALPAAVLAASAGDAPGGHWRQHRRPDGGAWPAGARRGGASNTGGNSAGPGRCCVYGPLNLTNPKFGRQNFMSFPQHRPRRLRTTPAMRRLTAQYRLDPAELILPAFVREGLTEPNPLSSMPGVVQHTLDSLKKAASEAVELGVGGIMLFGIPSERDAAGSAGTDPNGILNRGIAAVREEVGDDLVIMSDVCLDEFTDHGHCGVLDDQGRVDNDATLEIYGRMAVEQARAGAHVLGPSGMMDGQIAVIRQALDTAGHTDVSLFAYAAKYASAFYGPFREAVDSQLKGDRRTYQMDSANRREALLEVELDLEEGADMVMVKPAMSYLDVLADVAAMSPVPVGAYQISGEYAMIEAAAANGWIDRRRAIEESVLGIKRAGANMILTYWATELAAWLKESK
jgi:porphobilinogen synthase